MKHLEQLETEIDNLPESTPSDLTEYILLFWGVIKAALIFTMLFTNKKKDEKIKHFIFTVENLKDDIQIDKNNN